MLTYKLLYAFDIFQIKSGSFAGKAGHVPGMEHLLGIQVRPMRPRAARDQYRVLAGEVLIRRPHLPCSGQCKTLHALVVEEDSDGLRFAWCCPEQCSHYGGDAI